ncbi:cytochrome P450 [Embleya hyalina]|uniref:Cytochrome P450 n=1 Tax=Embleya hyalina TaxID=516124 RepID=A0A401Z6Z2_9ACTN|nr:cytochrome P450 [Embleya hyalina]GCE02613.1 cytochrome P450 [Embleya hyalina]
MSRNTHTDPTTDRHPPRFARLPGARPLFGHAPALLRRPFPLLAAAARAGDLVEIRLGPKPAYLACTPELVREVLLHPETYDRGGVFIDAAREIVGAGLVTCPWSQHPRQRRLVRAGLTQARLRTYAPIMIRELEAAASVLREDVPFDLRAEVGSISARVIVKTMISACPTDADENAIATMVRDLPVVMSGLVPHMIVRACGLRGTPTRGDRAFRRARERLYRAVDAVVADYRAHPRAPAGTPDMLRALMDHRDDDGEAFTDRELRDQVMTVLTAGQATTAVALAWTFKVLADHPEVEARVFGEIDRVLAGHPVTAEDLPRLEYTRRVLTETLRMYPPVWIFTENVAEPTRLAGTPLPAGATIVWSPHQIHHDARWYPDPERFDPDRWLPEHAATTPTGAFLGFGAGPRRCAGADFAHTEMLLTLAVLTRGRRFRPAPGARVHPITTVEYATGPLYMTYQSRSPRTRRPGAAPDIVGRPGPACGRHPQPTDDHRLRHGDDLDGTASP